jgi:hypothetical protein
MRTLPALLVLAWFCLIPSVGFSQGQATLPDELLSKDPPKAPAQPKKAAPQTPKPGQPEGASQVSPEKKAPSGTPAYLDASKYTTRFEDTFADNKNHWDTGDHKGWKGEIRDGGYILEHKRNDLGWIVSRTMGFDAAANYLIEVEYSVISGPADGSFGIVIGHEKNGDILKFHRFSVSFDGVYHYADRVWNLATAKPVAVTDIVTKTDAPSYRKGFNVKNTLKVIHYGDRMYLFVNGVQVNEFKYKAPSGEKLGFMAWLNSVVKVTRFTYKTIG